MNNVSILDRIMLSTQTQVVWKKNDLYYQYEDKRYTVEVREATSRNDFDTILRINRSAFPHDNETDDYARQWIQHNWNTPYYVITYDQLNVVGYILWAVKGGYKRRIACELEQIATDIKYRQQGFASFLMKISLIKFQYSLQQRLKYSALKIGTIHLTTGCNNYEAQSFYKKILKVEQKGGTIGAIYGTNEYGEEEISMINENVEPIVEKLVEEYNTLKL